MARCFPNPAGRPAVKLRADEELLAVNAAYDQIRRALDRLRRVSGFDVAELARLSEMAAEARAVTNSALLGVLETAETAEAGQRFHARLQRQRREE